MKKFLLVFSLMILSIGIFAQSLTGTIVDQNDQEPLIGASVYVLEKNIGTVTDYDGTFTLSGVENDDILAISYIGYTDKEMVYNSDSGSDIGTISMTSSGVGLQEVLLVADVAIDRKTPVAVTTLKGEVIEAKLGNQEFPEILRKSPSVYATKEGGGFGDARLNIRGFEQENFAVMINGIPVNDMENGRVFWSNWAGLSDVTSRLQYQRGLTASKLAVPTIGGSVNIITNPAEFERGGKASVSVGNDGFLKGALSYSTGLSQSGWAATFQLAHTRGNGYVNFTKFRANSVFGSVSKTFGNSGHMISLTALAAPQWHHQRPGASRFDRITLRTFNDPDETGEEGTNLGIKWNHVGGTLNGEEFTFRRNFYSKPKVFLNHYWDINDKLNLKTSVYYSQGRGGGTGPRGRLRTPGSVFDSFSGLGQGIHNDQGEVRFDDIVRYNQGEVVDGWGDAKPVSDEFGGIRVVSEDGRIYTDENGNVVSDDLSDSANRTANGSGFIRRASMNSHNWFGALSTLDAEMSDNLTLTTGLDYRYYKGIHYRRLENLLGADGYSSKADINEQDRLLQTESPADFGNFNDNSYQDRSNILNYWNDGLVSWVGLFAQVEYTVNKFSLFTSISGANQGFKRIDYFNYLTSDPARETEWQNFKGGTFKAGLNYNIDKRHNVFFNTGYYSKQPLFDNVFVNFRNDLNENVQNQSVTSFEIGYGYRSSKLNVDVNVYRTEWTDRQFDLGVELDNDEEGQALFSGVGQTHSGLEVEIDYTLNRKIDFYSSVTLGDWKYSSNFEAVVTNLDSGQPAGNLTIFGDGLQVGGSAQTKFTIGANVTIIEGLRLYADYTFFDRLYANYDIDDEQFQEEGGVIAKLPSYSLVDAGLSYALNIGNFRSSIRLNVNNVLDATYISRSFTNIEDDPMTTDVNEIYNNRGFWGFGRTWNVGYKVWF